MKEHERLEKITSLIRRLGYDLHDGVFAREEEQQIIMRLLEYALDNCFMEEEV